MRSYLENRSQYVKYNGFNSSRLNIKCGVPQGSILNPLLFLVYINDIMDVSQTVTPVLYADDTNLIISGTNLNDVIVTLNDELTKFMLWMNTVVG